MTRKEIRRDINNKIIDLGVKDAYKYFVIENAKVIKKQFPPLKTEKDKAMLISLTHNITVKGFKDVNMFNKFKTLFESENIIKDKIWDYVLYDLIKIADN